FPEPFWPTTPIRAASSTSMSRPFRTVRAPNDFTALRSEIRVAIAPVLSRRGRVPPRGKDAHGGVLRRGVRNRDHAARPRPARSRGGGRLARPRPPHAVAARRNARPHV